jgi:hypothetical protein
VGATVSAIINEQLFDELDAPVVRLCMEDAPVPYASEMEVRALARFGDPGARRPCTFGVFCGLLKSLTLCIVLPIALAVWGYLWA